MSATASTACLLADDPLVQIVLERHQALELAGDQLADGDAGARLDDRRDVGLADHEAVGFVGRLGAPSSASRASSCSTCTLSSAACS